MKKKTMSMYCKYMQYLVYAPFAWITLMQFDMEAINVALVSHVPFENTPHMQVFLSLDFP